MVALPYDVHFEVIDWVYRNSQHGNIDRRTLRACSLVCKGWTTPAQRLLFRRIGAGLSLAKRGLLLTAVRQNPLLGTHARFFDILLFIGAESVWAPETDGSLALLALLPNLNGLYLHASIDPSSIVSIVERMRGMNLRLQHLKIGNTPELISPLLRLWPDLQSVDIFNYPSGPPSDLPEPPIPLKVPRSAAIHWGCPLTARWLLEAADTSALRELEVSYVRWDDPLCLGAFNKTRALENLTSLFIGGALPPQAVLNRLVRLETLVFAKRPGEAAVVLPRTLRHVGYHVTVADDWLVPLRCLVDALKALPSLGLVTATRELSPTDLAELTRGCQEICVEFVVLSDARMFRRMQNVDWI
ncbi:hypothetical protein FA95DRAFT_1665557 [Auriscalpium vulgare]|uniref:Uncharacterized protein n=1 Tax=Auriscalpium vulgare TaxID=40419 RepID=A0ACB8RSU0_9AGAM|nr:hypothetical protein FA95DRAFT_1665557 [Auriscalpium vulgare]